MNDSIYYTEVSYMWTLYIIFLSSISLTWLAMDLGYAEKLIG